ncbi:TolB family protein [Kitasatospora sp. NPDC059577]|uniref:TolB family protein n=1 Tax=Kitasatospora sp. NPDC059577 TaxID=3346873 RepID=UPI00369BAFCB
MTTARTRRRLARTACVLAAVTAVGAVMPAAEARPPKGDTARVSEGPKGEGLDRESFALGLSGDGRLALFSSSATNLLPGGAGAGGDVYLRDLRNGHLQRVSVADDGASLNAGTGDAAISGDGRYVVFGTAATNLLPALPKHANDIYVRDLWTGRTELVTAADGSSGVGDDQSRRTAYNPAISWDGRYVTYSSDRSDLAPGVRAGKFNIFVTDRWTHTTRVVSTGADGSPADNSSYSPTISADGSRIEFNSRAGNLLPAAETPPAAKAAAADTADEPGAPRTTAAGTSPRLAGLRAYPDYVWDSRTGKITGASLDETGELQGGGSDGQISPSGRYVVYDLFQPGGRPGSHGRHSDVFLHELATGKVTKVSNPLPGATDIRDSFNAAMSLTDEVFFASDADDLVPGDTNEQTDIFRYSPWTGRTDRVSLTRDDAQSTASSYFPRVDAFGTTLLFTADDGNLVPGDDNQSADVFRRRL